MLLLEALHQEQFKKKKLENKSGSEPLNTGNLSLRMHWTNEGQTKFQHCTLHELTCRETKVSIISDFLPETMHSRRPWGDIFRVLKEKKTKTKNNDLEFCIQHNYPSKVKEKYRSLRSKSRPALQETVFKVLQREGKGQIRVRNSDLHKEKKSQRRNSEES